MHNVKSCVKPLVILVMDSEKPKPTQNEGKLVKKNKNNVVYSETQTVFIHIQNISSYLSTIDSCCLHVPVYLSTKSCD